MTFLIIFLLINNLTENFPINEHKLNVEKMTNKQCVTISLYEFSATLQRVRCSRPTAIIRLALSDLKPSVVPLAMLLILYVIPKLYTINLNLQ